MTDATDPEDEVDASSAPLIEHLAELRTRLIRCVLAFVVGMVLAFAIADPILQFLLGPIKATLQSLGDPDPTFQFTSPQELLFTYFRISMVFGFILAFPVISFQMWRFVAPGLYRTEKAAFLPFLLASPFMFLLGAAFAHFVVTPLAMNFFLGFADLPSIFTNMLTPLVEDQAPTSGGIAPLSEGGPLIPPGVGPAGDATIVFFGKVNESLDISLKFIIAFGLCFQLPVLLTLMGKAGLVTSRGLQDVRKYAIVGILVLAALVTPPDVITQLILFTVVYGLYEISIWLVRGVERKKEDQLRAEGILGEDETLFDFAGDDPEADEDDEAAK